jgi:hypothetical protein
MSTGNSNKASHNIGSGASWRPNSEVLAQRLGDEMILVHLQTNRIYRLNKTAARVWELMSAGENREALFHRLLEEFAVSSAQLVKELDGLFARLQAEKLLYPGGEG